MNLKFISFSPSVRESIFNELHLLTKSGYSFKDSSKKILFIYGEKSVQGQFAKHLIEAGNSGDITKGLDEWLSGSEKLIFSKMLLMPNPHKVLKSLTKVTSINTKILASISKIMIPILMILALPVLIYFMQSLIEALNSIAPMKDSIVVVVNFVHKYILAIYFFLISGITLLFYLLISWDGKYRKNFNQFPIFRIYTMIQGIGFFTVLSGLLNSGLRVNDAIIEMRNNASKPMKLIYNNIIDDLKKGRTVGSSIADQHFPSAFIGKRVASVSETKNFSEFIEDLGEDTINDILEQIESNTTQLQVAMLIVIALVFVWLLSGLDFSGIQA